jgi:hypothetical protein
MHKVHCLKGLAQPSRARPVGTHKKQRYTICKVLISTAKTDE